MYGRFKFVLDKDENLYIGFAHNDFHQDICGNLPRGQIKAAGYLFYDDGKWVVNGKSVGYGISYSETDIPLIQKILSYFDEETIIGYMNENNRMTLSN